MNDPLKEFVEQNRAAFDELKAPPFNLEGFKARQNPVAEPKVKKLWPGTKWLVAASLLITFGTAFLFLREDAKSPSADKLVQKVDVKATQKAGTYRTEKVQPLPALQNAGDVAKAPGIQKVKQQFKVEPQLQERPDVYAKLSDSSSSSNRLQAILEIGKAGQMSNDVLNRLAKTLNHDDNSNVRLAALSVLEKYSYDTHAASLLVGSLNTQTDPMVQLGLVSILGKMKNLDINDKLYALANDPNTFDAVKDEAYSILLKDDKL